MKIAKYELKVVHKKKLILTMEDNVDSENLLKIFLETQVKEEKEQDGLIGIIAEKVSEDLLAEKALAFLFFQFTNPASFTQVFTLCASYIFISCHTFFTCRTILLTTFTLLCTAFF